MSATRAIQIPPSAAAFELRFVPPASDVLLPVASIELAGTLSRGCGSLVVTKAKLLVPIAAGSVAFHGSTVANLMGAPTESLGGQAASAWALELAGTARRSLRAERARRRRERPMKLSPSATRREHPWDQILVLRAGPLRVDLRLQDRAAHARTRGRLRDRHRDGLRGQRRRRLRTELRAWQRLRRQQRGGHERVLRLRARRTGMPLQGGRRTDELRQGDVPRRRPDDVRIRRERLLERHLGRMPRRRQVDAIVQDRARSPRARPCDGVRHQRLRSVLQTISRHTGR